MTGAPDRETIDTLIIGAGPSGMAVAACLTQAGRPFVILEAKAHVGSTWRTHYARLHLHTAKRYSGLPFMEMPDAYPTYPSRQQVVDYLDAYAKRFSLAPRFGTRVTRAAHRDGGWQVDTDTGPSLFARQLVVAAGYNRVPYTPAFDGLDTFSGEVVHSATYGSGARFVGKDVLVVGCGNSGAEIAIDLWEQGARPSLCIRGPLHVVPRDIFGLPAQRTTVMLRKLPPKLVDRLTLPLVRRLIGDLTPWGIRRPDVGPLEQVSTLGRVPLIDVGTVDLIKQGAVQVVGAIASVGPDHVRYQDGSERPCDAIVMATGYKAALDGFLEGASSVTDARGYPTVHGREATIPGLFFCGYRNPHTGGLRESAIEARRIAAAIGARRG